MRLLGALKRAVVGFGYGVGSFVLGYVVVYLLKGSDVESVRESVVPGVVGSVGQALPSTGQLVAWLYFSAQHADLQVTGTSLAGSTTTTASLRQTPVWDGYLLAIPPAVLVLAGSLYARRNGPDAFGIGAATSIAIGYVVTSVVVAFLSLWTVSVGIAAAYVFPNVAHVVLYGAVYGLCFVPIGLYLGSRTATSGGNAAQGMPTDSQARSPTSSRRPARDGTETVPHPNREATRDQQSVACPECGAVVDATATVCPSCGTALSQ